jgi:hypothetical protein
MRIGAARVGAFFACMGLGACVTPPPPPPVVATPPGPAPAPLAVATSPVAPPPPSCDTTHFPEDAWEACLFADRDTKRFVASERWASLDHDWGAGGPRGLADDFSVEARRLVCLPAGTYVFDTVSDDGLQVFADDELLLDEWGDHSPLAATSRPVTVDGCVPIRVRYFEHQGGAVLRVTPRPAARAATCDTTSFPKGLAHVCLFAGRTRKELLGETTWSTLEAPWDADSGPYGRVDDFAVEARTTACFDKGEYMFHTRSDDGLRVLVDGKPVIDFYTDHSPTVRDSVNVPLEGCHRVEVDYYENGGASVLDVAWAKAGSPRARRWDEERPCGGCADGARCVDAARFGGPKGGHVCARDKGESRSGEACGGGGARCGGGRRCVKSCEDCASVCE